MRHFVPSQGRGRTARSLLLSTALAGAIQLIPVSARAQSGIITACYPAPKSNGNPGSGVVYRINRPIGSAPGAPAQCSSGDIEFSWNQVGPQGVPGPQGPQGRDGPQGPIGPSGVLGFELVANKAFIYGSPDGNPVTSAGNVGCPAGKRALGGGFRTFMVAPFQKDVFVVMSRPMDNGAGWMVEMDMFGNQQGYMEIWATCVIAP